MAKHFKISGSKYTLAVARMEHHYLNLGLLSMSRSANMAFHAPAWTNDRVNRFCRLRGCTLEEMAMFFLVPVAEIRKCFQTNRWPSVLALHLQHYEAYMLSQLTSAEQSVWPPKVFVGPPNDFCHKCGRRNRRRASAKSEANPN